MKIIVEVTITAYRADGTQVQVTNGAKKQTGDNPRFAGDEAAEVADAARIRSMLLDLGIGIAATDAELESFQALRRQTRNEPER